MFYKDKLVLVTGGTGFIGTHVVKELLMHGARVRIPIHNRFLRYKNERIETISADLTRQEDCLKVLEGVQYVFHAAGAVGAAGVSSARAMEAITVNLILSAQMLEAAWSANVERFLIFSSSTVYPVVHYAVKEEETWSGPLHPAYFGYGWMKRYIEKLAEYVFSKSGLKIALARPTAVYGPGDNFNPQTCHVIPALIRRAIAKENPYIVWGTGDEVRDFIHVSDLARASLFMLEKYAVCEPVNIGYGKGVTIKEVVYTILEAAGHTMAEVIFDSKKPTTIPFRMVDTSKAKRELAFEPKITIREGIYDTVRWFVQQQELSVR